MKFKEFKEIMQQNFKNLTKNTNQLFEVSLDKDELWNLYLDSFLPGTNEIYRERREYDCSCCKQFIRAIGNAVCIDENNKIQTIWDFETNDLVFQIVIDALSKHIRSKPVTDIYFSQYAKIGTDKNYEELKNGIVHEWDHFYLELPNNFVNRSGKTEGDVKGSYRDIKSVFQRSLNEISKESVLTVLELISQNSLYKGEEWKSVLEKFLTLKKEYEKLNTDTEKNNYAWTKSIDVGSVIGKIRNHSIGTLLVDISENMDLDQAVRRYEQIVAPTNYKRPKAIFTKQMLEDAKKEIEKLGYLESLNRRYANLDDITVNNILFSNKDASKRISGNVFDDLVSDVVISPKKFSKIEEVPVNDFIENVLPTAREIEVFFKNKHSPNLVSLIAPENKKSPSMFKWDNSFGWAYSGNITDSSMKERVKSAGGNVEGVLRFSIQWNDTPNSHDKNDLDAHCHEPHGNVISFRNMSNYRTTGVLDVDIRFPNEGSPAVENITWSNLSKMENGKYEFLVHNFANRGGKNGFKAEIEFEGNIYSFEYNKELRQEEKVLVAYVHLENGLFRIEEKIPSNLSSKQVWNIKTNQFIPVSVIMFSPNYWDQQNGIGHRHYFFMLKDCVNSESPHGFYNEFLKEDLMKHKRVFEALGGKMSVREINDQLSGLGFSSTKRNELIVKIKNQSERILKIKF